MPDDAVIREYRPSDAAEVARMWNESDEMWPGGFTRGVPLTAQRVQADLERGKMIALYLAVVDGRVAGYCRLTESREEDGVAYVALLNVHPAYQRRGYARDLLKASLERTCREGYDRLDLHTWPGNMRAVPLYKKSGYFWVPETSVHMENYMPLLLRTPLLADFFARHDWYRTMVRDLSVREDDVSLGGMRIYPYRWEAGGEAYEATIDAEGKGLTALRTPTWRAACIALDYRLVTGMPSTVRWEIERLDGGEGHVTLLAEGEHGLRLKHEAQATVRGLFATEATVEADPEAERRPRGLPAQRIDTTLVLDGTLLRLTTGQRVGPAVELIPAPRFWSVPGTTKPMHLRLRNHLDVSVRGTLRLTPPPVVAMEPAPVAFEAPAGGYAGASVPVGTMVAGQHLVQARLDVHAGERSASYALDPLPLVACEPGIAVAGLDREEATLETDSALLTLHLRGGGWALQDKGNEEATLRGAIMLGPPFDWAQRERLRYAASVQRGETGDTIALRAEAWGFPGVQVEHRFSFVGDRTVRMQTVVLNASGEARQLRCVHHFMAWGLRDAGTAAPMATGLVADRAPGFPDWREEALEQPSALSEPWLAFETGGAAVGFFWEQASRIELGLGPTVASPDVTMAPGASMSFDPLHAVVADGGWRRVRDRWRDLARPDAPDDLGPEHRALELRAVPGPVLAPGDGQALAVTSRYTKQLPLRVRVEPPPGWSVRVESPHHSTPLQREQTQQVALAVRRDGGAYLAWLEAGVQAGAMHRSFALPLLDPGAGPVRLRQEELTSKDVWVAENAAYRLTVAPSFAGAIRLDYHGENQLLSAFPEPRAFSWTHPWFGGLSPYVFLTGLERWEGFPDPGRLPHEHWEASEVMAHVAGNAPWRGVRLACRLRSAGMVGLAVAVDYLLPPAAPLLALRLRVSNESTAPLRGDAGIYAFLQPGGRLSGRLVVDTPTRWQLERGPQAAEFGSGRWAAVHDPDSKVAVALVSPPPSETIALDVRDEGMHLSSSRHRLDLAPGQTRVLSAWLVLGTSVEEVEQAKLLGEVAPVADEKG